MSHNCLKPSEEIVEYDQASSIIFEVIQKLDEHNRNKYGANKCNVTLRLLAFFYGAKGKKVKKIIQ